MRAHAQRQGFQTLQKQEGVERAHRRAEVAQHDHPHPQDVGDRTERLGGLDPDGAVIARIGIVQRREALGVRLPVEVAAVDHQAADRGAVAADVLGRRIHDHGGAVLQRPADDRRRGVVDDQRHAQTPAALGDLADRKDVQLRVRQRLRVPAARARVGGAGERLGIGRIDEADLDAERAQRVHEQVPGPAVEVGRTDEIVSGAAEVEDAERRRGLPRRAGERGRAALQRGEALLQSVAGRVHDAGVDVAEFAQGEQVLRVLRVLELIGGRLVDRHRDRAGRRVAAVPAVQHDRLRVHPFRQRVLLSSRIPQTARARWPWRYREITGNAAGRR